MASPNTVKTPTSIMTSPAALSSPNRRQRPPRPKITLNIPPPNNNSNIQSPFMYPPPQSAMSGGTNKSGFPESEDGFMTHIGDFTKAGLGHGERVALWIYEKFSKWSKKWFTHIFLALVMILYSMVMIIGLICCALPSVNYPELEFGGPCTFKLKCPSQSSTLAPIYYYLLCCTVN